MVSMMELNKLKRDYKFKSRESHADGRRNRTLIIGCIAIMLVLLYLSKYLR